MNRVRNLLNWTRKFVQKHPGIVPLLQVTGYLIAGAYVVSGFLSNAHALWARAVHAVIAVIISESIAHLITQFILWPEREERLLKIVSAVFEKEIQSQTASLKKEITRLRDEVSNLRKQVGELSNIKPFGVESVEDGLDYARLFQRLRPKQTLLWHDTFHPDPGLFLDELVEAVRRGANIKMLAHKPNCETARYRAKELKGPIAFTEKSYNDQLQSFIEAMDQVMELAGGDASGSFTIRLYDDLPCMPIYIVLNGDVAIYGFTGFFLNRATAFRCPHIRWGKAEREVLCDFASYFLNKWNDHDFHANDEACLV